jgi:hypothetical protein
VSILLYEKVETLSNEPSEFIAFNWFAPTLYFWKFPKISKEPIISPGPHIKRTVLGDKRAVFTQQLKISVFFRKRRYVTPLLLERSLWNFSLS